MGERIVWWEEVVSDRLSGVGQLGGPQAAALMCLGCQGEIFGGSGRGRFL